MKVFVIICRNSDDDSILFIDSVRKNEQDAIKFCSSLSADAECRASGIYFDYEEETVL